MNVVDLVRQLNSIQRRGVQASMRKREQPSIRHRFAFLSSYDYLTDFLLVTTGILLYVDRGLTAFSIFLLIGTQWLVEAISEVPTGIIADRYGRHISVSLSFVLRSIAFALIFFSSNTAILFLAHIVAGVGATLVSGALEAWAVDENHEDGCSLDTLFATSRIGENVGLVAGTMIGAGLGTISLAFPFAGAAAVSFFGIWIALILMAPSGQHQPRSELNGNTTKLSENLRANRALAPLFIAAGLFSIFRSIPAVQWTPYFGENLMRSLFVLALVRICSDLLQIPLLGGLQRLVASGRLSRPQWLVGSSAMAFVSIVIASQFEGDLAVIAAIAYFVFAGLFAPSLRAEINERIGVDARATTLSVIALLQALSSGVGLLAMGVFLADLSIVRVTWPIAGVGLLGVGLVVAYLSHHSDQQPKPVKERAS